MTRLTRLAAGGVLLVLAAYGLHAAWPTGELRDYGSFVASGRAATEGENPYGIHPLTFHVALPGFEVWNPNLNPPVSIPVFQVFDLVDPHRGFAAWWGVSLLCYVAAIALLTRRYGGRRRWLLVPWALALAGFWDTLALGQIYLPLVLAAVGAWLLLERGREVTAGILIGLLVAVKPNFGIWPALLLLTGRWRTTAACGVTVAALWSVPLVMFGPEIYAQWFALIAGDRGRTGFLTNASLPGLAARVGLAPVGLAGAATLMAAAIWWTVRRRPDALRTSETGIALGILASPIAWVHYTLFLLPLFFSRRALSWPLAAAAALLVVPVPVVLRLLDAPLWQQVSAGSVYNWAALLCLAGVLGLRAGRMQPGRADNSRPDPGHHVPQPHSAPLGEPPRHQIQA